jgi:hypothetical protein
MLDPLATRRLDFERDILLFLIERVKRADGEGSFPPELIAGMNLLCRLRSRYRLAYFATHPEPHTGKPLNPALIEIGLDGLRSNPIAPLP